MHEFYTKYENIYIYVKGVEITNLFSFTFNKQECCTSGGDMGAG
jgi:hypothetical protein